MGNLPRLCSRQEIWCPLDLAIAAPPRSRIRAPGLKLAQEGYQVLLLLFGELQFLDEVEELHRVFQRQAAAVVEVGRAVLDAPQRKGFHRPIPGFVLEEPLHVQVMHLVVKEEWRRVAGGALGLAEK